MNNWERKYDKEYEECEQDEIKELLLYHKIIKVNDDTIELDNGTVLEIEANRGCCGCGAGDYSITELNDCDNAITNVEFVCDNDCKDINSSTSYKIFVYAEDKYIKLLQVDGDDGNGYYGTGYTIYVKFNKT